MVHALSAEEEGVAVAGGHCVDQACGIQGGARGLRLARRPDDRQTLWRQFARRARAVSVHVVPELIVLYTSCIRVAAGYTLGLSSAHSPRVRLGLGL